MAIQLHLGVGNTIGGVAIGTQSKRTRDGVFTPRALEIEESADR
jgi:hypothetical protein